MWFRRCELEKDGREGDVKASRGQGECDIYFHAAISQLHYKYHSIEPKQWVRCDFSDPTIFSSCRNNARVLV